MKFGTGFKYVTSTNPQLFSGWGVYYFAGAPSTYPNPYQFSQAFAINPGSEIVNPKSTAFFLFAQDDWKVRQNVTLNLGVRYDLESPTNIRNYVAPVDKNNIQPRVGLTWDPTGQGKMAVRGGVGMYSNQHLFYHLNRAQLQGADGTVTLVLAPGNPIFPTYPNVLPSFPPGSVLPARDIWKIADDLKNPRSVQATAGFERTLARNLVLSVDYVYVYGYDLMGTIDVNAAASVPKGTLRTVAQADATRPTVPAPNGFRKVLTITNDGRSWYHGLQLKTTRSTARLTTMLSYTLSQGKDMLNPWNPPEDSWNIEADKALAASDQRHNFVGSVNYVFPGQGLLAGGWALSGIFQIRDGRPYNVIYGGDPTGTTQRDARPGDRNTGKTTGYVNFDLALVKRIPFGGRSLELRAEAFNTFNRTNYSSFDGAMSSASYGKPVGAYDKRKVQLAGVFRF